MNAARPHRAHGPEPVRCTDCGAWRLRGRSCTTCYPPTGMADVAKPAGPSLGNT